jgi:hypothetical protein
MMHRLPFVRRWWLVPIIAAVVGGHLLLPLAFVHLSASLVIASSLVVATLVVIHLGVAAILGRPLWRAHASARSAISRLRTRRDRPSAPARKT